MKYLTLLTILFLTLTGCATGGDLVMAEEPGTDTPNR
jgi:hypothetical protein